MKKYFSTFCIALLLVSMSLSYVYAADTTFKTSLAVIGDDNFPPSIPADLTATAVSSSQINLTWSASTDDVQLAGYRIFRDGNFLATTSALSYEDINLSSFTSYSYTVEAFDTVPRFSGQSDPETAITSNASVESSTEGGRSGQLDILIYDLLITPSTRSSVIDFSTNQIAQVKIFWGKTVDYELGSVSGFFYKTDHSATLLDLEPDTRYFYKIQVTSIRGLSQVFESSFQTERIYQESLLTNVLNFKATPFEKSIALNWNIPRSTNFDSVRLIKSDKFFPRDVNDGEVIYEGSGQVYEDLDVLVGTTYYYSIFSKDSEGNYSSGMLAQARIKPRGEIEIPTSKDPFANIPVLKNVDPTIYNLSLLDFDFIQDGKKIETVGNTIVIDGSKNLTISLKYEKIAEVLKTIAFTLIDPSDSTKVFPFLLRVNGSKTAYTATLAPLEKSGTYEMKIIILDYKNQGLKRLEGSLQAFVFEKAKELVQHSFDFKRGYLLLILILLLLLIAYLIDIHRCHDKDKENSLDINESK